tara:strand:- start:147 stop:740 length:594 start_codon:yes stop_codon:yes gene_type:complete
LDISKAETQLNLSRNEFISLCKKSLRGKGHHWGVCEDLSTALLALAINQFPAQNILLEVLNTENSKINRIFTIIDSQVYKTSDQIDGQFYDPILILGLISVDRDFDEPPLEISLENNDFILTNELIIGDRSYSKKKVNTISFCKNISRKITKQKTITRISIDDTTLKEIENWANMTYVPATEESRQLGAGSDWSDND